MICKILRLFVNTLTADDENFLLNGDNLLQPIQMQLYRKEKSFSEFVCAFLNAILNFKHFPSEDDSYS